MNEKETAAWTIVAGLGIIGTGSIFLTNRDMVTIGTILIITGIFAVIYYGFKLTQIGKEHEKERTGIAAGLCIGCAILAIAVSVVTVPEISEEIEEGGIIVPTYSATVVITVDPDQILVGKDFTLYQDNRQIEKFHLRAWEEWKGSIEVTWKGSPIEKVTFRVVSSGAEGLGDVSDSRIVQLTDGAVREITLRA